MTPLHGPLCTPLHSTPLHSTPLHTTHCTTTPLHTTSLHQYTTTQGQGILIYELNLQANESQVSIDLKQTTHYTLHHYTLHHYIHHYTLHICLFYLLYNRSSEYPIVSWSPDPSQMPAVDWVTSDLIAQLAGEIRIIAIKCIILIKFASNFETTSEIT